MSQASHRYRPSAMWGFYVVCKNVFFLACVLIAVFGIVGLAAGWITFDHSDNRETTTIEIDTGEIKATADEALDKTKKLID